MKKILILSENIFRDSSANGVCTRNLIDELLDRGYRVFCVSEPASPADAYRPPEGLEIISVRQPWYSRFLESGKGRALVRIVSLLRYMVTIFTYPDVSPGRTRRVTRACEAVLERERIDLVLGLYRPYESIAALMRLKRKHGDGIRCVSYHLDLLLSPNNGSLVRRYKIAVGKRALEKELRLLDRVLLPEGAAGAEGHPKVRYVGFPLFVKKPAVPCETGFRKDLVNVTYVGSLDGENRDPAFFLKIISETEALRGRVFVHFWGRTSDAVLATIRRYPQIAAYRGVLENAFVPFVYEQSDLLLNVSNRNTPDMIPSKIYQMFASGRPIVNCVSDPNDRAAKIIAGYPASFALYEYKDNDPAALADFLTRPHDPCGLAEDAFASGTPRFVVDAILAPFGTDA